jgi:RND superfamily putative drug exporter
LRALARFCYDRRRLVFLGWIGLLIALMFISSAVKTKYRTDFKLPGSESQAALDLLQERGANDRTGVSTQIVFTSQNGIDDPAVKARMEQFFHDVTSSVSDASINSPYDEQNAFQVAPDRKTAYGELNMGDRSEEAFADDADTIKALWRQIDQPGLTVDLGGDLFAQFSQPNSEAFGIAAAIIILIIAFGSLLAMGLPIVTALFGVVCGSFIIAMLTRVLAVPDFTTLIASLIGIGVGIDYSLLIVTRYRAALHAGKTPREAVVLAVDTSGRAVLFAGMTVVISLLGLFMMNLDFMRSMALGAMSAVLMTLFAAITLLPAFLGFVGYSIDRPRWRDIRRAFSRPHIFLMDLVLIVPRTVMRFFRPAQRVERPADFALTTASGEGDESSFWYKWSRVIQKNPWPAMVLSAGLLIALAIPVFSMRLGFSDAGNRVESDTTRRAYDLLAEAFGPGFNGPIFLVIDSRAGGVNDESLAALETAVHNTPGVADVSPAQPITSADLVLMQAFPTTAPQDKQTTDLVHRLRDQTLPSVSHSTGMRILTAGFAPSVVDFSDYTAARLPWFIGAVLLLSFVLLLTVFHSVVVPLKAVIMNLLSIGAAFGLTIVVFQWGFGESLLGVGKAGPVEAWAPMFIFAIVFGLSMDYEVFLLARVREEYDRNGFDNGAAVADGLAATGRVISAAAAIMVCVFGAFILGDDRSVKMVGFALASAIFIDATIVRLILVPAAMELLGRRNWWAPDWLVRRLPTIKVDAEPEPSGAGGGSGG